MNSKPESTAEQLRNFGIPVRQPKLWEAELFVKFSLSLFSLNITPAAKILLSLLIYASWKHRERSDDVFFSYKDLSRFSGLGVKMVRNAVEELKATNLVEIESKSSVVTRFRAKNMSREMIENAMNLDKEIAITLNKKPKRGAKKWG